MRQHGSQAVRSLVGLGRGRSRPSSSLAVHVAIYAVGVIERFHLQSLRLVKA
jgi:hypothetical protein